MKKAFNGSISGRQKIKELGLEGTRTNNISEEMAMVLEQKNGLVTLLVLTVASSHSLFFESLRFGAPGTSRGSYWYRLLY